VPEHTEKIRKPGPNPRKGKKWENYFSLKDKQQPRQEIAAAGAAGKK